MPKTESPKQQDGRLPDFGLRASSDSHWTSDFNRARPSSHCFDPAAWIICRHYLHEMLVIGSGGRRTRLVWNWRSRRTSRNCVRAGQRGIALERLQEFRARRMREPRPEDLPKLLAFAQEKKLNSRLSGRTTRSALVLWFIQKNGCASGGQPESCTSSSRPRFSPKTFMEKYGIPTAKAGLFRCRPAKAFAASGWTANAR